MANWHEYETRRARGVAIARDVSAAVRRAGFPRAGRYTTFGGYASAGYHSGEVGNGTKEAPTASVSWIPAGSPDAVTPSDRAAYAAVIRAIRADRRFVVRRATRSRRRQGGRPAWLGSVHITRRS